MSIKVVEFSFSFFFKLETACPFQTCYSQPQIRVEVEKKSKDNNVGMYSGKRED